MRRTVRRRAGHRPASSSTLAQRYFRFLLSDDSPRVAASGGRFAAPLLCGRWVRAPRLARTQYIHQKIRQRLSHPQSSTSAVVLNPVRTSLHCKRFSAYAVRMTKPRKNPHAAALGRIGGSVVSERKTKSSRRNVALAQAARKRLAAARRLAAAARRLTVSQLGDIGDDRGGVLPTAI